MEHCKILVVGIKRLYRDAAARHRHTLARWPRPKCTLKEAGGKDKVSHEVAASILVGKACREGLQ